MTYEYVFDDIKKYYLEKDNKIYNDVIKIFENIKIKKINKLTLNFQIGGEASRP